MRLLSQRWRSDGSFKICCCYCLIDVALAIFVGLLCWLLFSGFVPPYKRGFYCSDQSIRLAYKPNTVSVTVLLTVSITVPILLIVWYHAWTFLIVSSGVETANSRNRADRIRLFFATGTSVGTEYFFGLMVVVALMHFGKSTFGVLRPHFLDICRPNASLVACELYRSSESNHQNRMDGDYSKGDQVKMIAVEDNLVYIDEPHCTTNDFFQLKVARESFPSGHTAVAVYALLFVLAFVRDRTRRMNTASPFGVSTSIFCPTIIRWIFYLISIIWTCFVCITRVTDHWHHWTDVAGGVALGVGVGSVLFFRKDSAFRNSLTQGKAVDY